MAWRSSDREEEQLILCSDVLAKILMDYLEKDQDILNFILASKIYLHSFTTLSSFTTCSAANARL